MTLSLRLLPLLLAVMTANTFISGASAQGDDPFRRWLRNLTIHIPDFSEPAGALNISITGFTCNHIDFDSLDSSYMPPLTYALSLTDLQIACAGNWRTVTQSKPHIHDHGGITAVIGGGSGISMALTLVQNESLAVGAKLSQFNMDVIITKLNFTGDFSKILNVLTGLVESLVKYELNAQAEKAVQKLVEVDLGNVLAKVDEKIRPYMQPVPPDPAPPVEPGTMDLENNGLIRLLDRIVDEKIGAPGINRLMNLLTHNTGTIQHHNISHLSFTVLDKPGVGTVVFGISDIVVAGLNSWSAFDLLRPARSYSLDTVTGMDLLAVNLTFYVNVSLSGHFSGSGLVEKAQLALVLEHNKLQASMQLALREAVLHSLNGAQYLSMGCLSTAVENINFTQFLLNTTVKEIDFIAVGGIFEQDIDDAVNHLLDLLISSFGPAIPAFLNGIVGGPVRHSLNSLLFNFVAEGLGETCPDSQIGIKQDSVTLVAPLSGAVALTLIICFVAVHMNGPKRGRSQASSSHRSSPITTSPRSSFGGTASGLYGSTGTAATISTSANGSASASGFSVPTTTTTTTTTTVPYFTSTSTSSSLSASNLVAHHGFSSEKTPLMKGSDAASAFSGSDKSLSESQPALIVHPRLPPVVRFGVVLLICINMALFIMSNTNYAASVYIVITMGGQTNILPDLFEFSLANSVHDMWVAGVYPLSLMIAIFSGFWPYFKLLMMIFCWVTPPSYLSEKRRETLFRILDALGKWSLIDTFVMVMMIVAFRFHIPAPSDPTTAMDVYVGAHASMLFFTLATMLSLVLSHLCLYVHRLITAEHKILSLPLEEKETLCSHRFRMGSTLAKFSRVGQAILPLVVLATMGALLAGSIIPAFEFVFKGAAAWALELLGQTTSTDYSLISLGRLMPQSSKDPNDYLIRFLQVSFFVFALAVPLANLLSLIVLWITPLTLRAQHRLFTLVEVFNAWSALDVFVFSILASLLELQQFAQFIIGGRCDGINVLLKQYFDKVLDGDDVCFDVAATLSSGCWVLFLAAFVTIVCSIVVMQTCHSALQERTRAVSRRHSMPNINADDEELDHMRGRHGREKRGKCNCDCCGKCSLICFYLGLAQTEYEV